MREENRPDVRRGHGRLRALWLDLVTVPPMARGPSMDRFWTRVAQLRVVQLVGMGVALAVLDVPHHWFLVGVIAAVGVPSTIAWSRACRHRGGMPPIAAYVDLAVLLPVVTLVPGLQMTSLLLLASLPLYAALAFGRRHAMVLIGLGLPTVILAAIIHHAPLGAGLIVIYAVTVTTTVVIIGESGWLVEKSQNDIDELISGLDVAVWYADESGSTVRYMSPSVETMFGWPRRKWYEYGFWESVVHPEDVAVTAESARKSALGEPYVLRYRLITADGSVRQIEERITTGFVGAVMVSSRGIMLDVTDRHAAEQRLHQLAQIVETIPIPLIVARLDDPIDDESLRITVVNSAAVVASGRAAADVVGKRVGFAYPNLPLAQAAKLFADVARDGVARQLSRPIPSTRFGEPRVYAGHAFPLPDRSVVFALIDVTDRENVATALLHQATHDMLTGLPNRRMLLEHLEKTLATETARGRAVSLVMADLDQFKEVNDALGHDHGDQLLTALGARLTRKLLPTELLARLGGDEFAIVIAHDRGADDAIVAAHRLAELFAEPVSLADVTIQTNASVGVATSDEIAADAETLIKRADIAMYRAKGTGTGVAVYEADHDRSSVRRVTLFGELRGAIKREELRLHYQPVYDLRAGRVVAVEALVRWQHPVHGLLAPAEFLEMAEVSGLIGPLSEWVVGRAVTDATTWRAAGHRIGVAVNLSVRNLYEPRLAERIGAIRDAAGLGPDALQLELTEHSVMHEPVQAAGVLRDLRARGLTVSIDDFGTAYSSLWLLRDLPVDELKIDRAFITAMAEGDARLVRSIIDLGHNLGLTVVAEGVEDLSVAAQLRHMGCDRAQGFGLARPMDLAALLSHLEQSSPELAAALR